MNTLNFDTGVKTFSVNGKCEVSYNPTDAAFAERLCGTFDALQEKYEAAKEKAAGDNVFAVMRELDAEMRRDIDGIFGVPLCDSLFGSMSLWALADGLPVWMNFLLAIIDTIDPAIVAEQKKTNPRLEKYTAKYAK